MSIIKDRKRISYSQFSTWYGCEFKFLNDYILKKKVFEDSLNMSFGTAIHGTIQSYLTTRYTVSEKDAELIDLVLNFTAEFKKIVTEKKIKHTPEELAEFIEDGRLILEEFVLPENRRRYFPREKYELIGIEVEINEPIFNNLNIVGFLDIVLKEKMSGDIKIIDFKTSTRGWSSEKEDFTKLSQLRMYKALYSKKFNIPLNKIHVEFFILKRKVYDNSKVAYPQTRLVPFKPTSYKPEIDETLSEFSKFVNGVFTKTGEYLPAKEFKKMPSDKQCKYCQYSKDGSCDKKKTPINL